MSLLKREDGAVAVMVAVFVTFIAMGVATLAIDGGSLWQSQRNLVTNTDAMAHAGAVRMVEYLKEFRTCPSDAEIESVVEALRTRNNVEDEVLAVVPQCDAQTFKGYVQVQARQPSDSFFSGRDDLSAFGTSTFDFSPVAYPAQGLAICQDVFNIAALKITSATWGGGKAFAIPYSDAQDDLVAMGLKQKDCGFEGNSASGKTVAGGWGWLMDVCEPNLGNNVSYWCDGDPGTNSLKKEFFGKTGSEFRLPIWDKVTGNGGGRFQIVGMAFVRIQGTCDIKQEYESGKDDEGNQFKNLLPPKINECGPSLDDYDTKYNGQERFLVVELIDVALYKDPPSPTLYDFPISSCAVTTDTGFCVK
jgi:hypothetical protein